MADLNRPDYGQVWASTGEKVAPDTVKMQSGWVQEMMPFQYENYLQARQDEAIVYLLQKGVPEYSPTQEYIANKSVVVYQGNLYMAIATVTNVLPTVAASWKRLNVPLATNGSVPVSSGGTGATTASEARTNLGLGSIATSTAPTTTGIVVKDANDSLVARLITGTSGNITITNPDGVAGNINVNVGSNVAQLSQDSSWTSKGGIRLPSGSTGERGVEVAGKIRYNTTLQKFEGFDGTSWNALGASSNIEITTLSGNGVTTNFTLNSDVFSAVATDVYIGGIYQNKSSYSVSGSTITFSEAPVAGVDNIQVLSRRVVDLGLSTASQVSIQDTANLYTSSTVEGALREVGDKAKYVKNAILSYPDYATASSAAATLPDGQEIEAPNADGRLSRFAVQSGALVFKDFAPDAIRLQSYTPLRAYTGKFRAVDITTPGVAGRFNRDAGDTTTADNGGTVIVDGLGRRWKRAVTGVLTPEMFGLVGDGSNENTQLQRLLDSAAGLEVAWTKGKTYGYTFLVVPDCVKFTGTDFTFRRMASNTSAGFRVNNWFKADYLRLSSPGDTSGDKALRIQGSYIGIGYFHAEADAQGVYNSINWAIEAVSNPAGTVLSRIKIDNIYCKNYSTTFVGTKLAFVEVCKGVIENYRTAVYLKDTVNSEFSNFKISGLGNAVNGGPGENGLLLEATTAGATSDLVFNDWTVEDSGEHAYRLGGQQTIKNVWFNRCVSRRSGSSILSGNLSSGEWHGGCGFKILGGASVGGTRHKNIYLNQCQVYDVNPTDGSYPTGHGVNNFTPFMVVCADGVYLNECFVDAEELSTAAVNGIIVGHSSRVYLNDCDFRKLRAVAIKPYQENLFEGFPGYATPLEEFHIRGGKYEVVGAGAGSGLVFYMAETALYAHKNWTINGTEMRGGTGAMRIEGLGAGGSYTGCRANFSYFDPTTVTDATATSPIVLGGGMASWLIDLTSNARPNAFGISVANGSVHRQMDTGLFRLRKGNNWVTL